MYINKMNWEEISNIDFDNSVIFIPAAPLEEHGPHAPTGVDCFIAEKACELSGEKLKNISKLKPYFFPLIPLGVANTTNDFPGTISIPEVIFAGMIYSILMDIANWGFKYCVIVATHGDTGHIASINAAIRLCEKKTGIQISEPSEKLLFNKLFDENEKVNNRMDIHAGAIETSIMLNIYPELIKKEKLPSLPTREVDITTPGSWKAKGAIEGYLGSPALASAELGIKKMQWLYEYADAAVQLVGGKKADGPKFLKKMIGDLTEKLSTIIDQL